MSNKYSYIIIDDESKAIKLLSNIISQYYDNLEMTGSYTTWQTALEALQEEDPDIVFVDISMPHKNGISLLEMVPDIDSEIIFVTAHEEHALKAYKFGPSGYILKPIKDERLRSTIDIALKRVQDKKLAEQFNAEKITLLKNKICIRSGKGLDYVNVDDILYFEATSRYTKIITKDKNYLSSYNIGKFRTMVEDYNFFAVHRSFIVNVDKIRRYETNGTLIMEEGYEIPVSKNVRESFLNLFNKV